MDSLVLHVRPRPTIRLYVDEVNRFSILASPDQSRHESGQSSQTPSTASPTDTHESVGRIVARRRRIPLDGKENRPAVQGKRLALSDLNSNVTRPAAKPAKPRRSLDARARGTSTTVRKAREAARAAKEAAAVAEAAARERSEGAVRADSPSPFEVQRAFIAAAEATALEADAEEATPPRGPGPTNEEPDSTALPPAPQPVPHVSQPSAPQPAPRLAPDDPFASSSAAAVKPAPPPLEEQDISAATVALPTPAQRLREQAQARLGAAQTALQAVRGSLSPPPVAAKSAGGAHDAPPALGGREVLHESEPYTAVDGTEMVAAAEPTAESIAECATTHAKEPTATEATEHGAQAGPKSHPVAEPPCAAWLEAEEAGDLPPRVPASTFLGEPALPEPLRQSATTGVMICSAPTAAPALATPCCEAAHVTVVSLVCEESAAPEARRAGLLERSLNACLAPARALIRAAEEAAARREAAGGGPPSLRPGKLGIVRRHGRRRTPRFVMPTISETVEVAVLPSW